MSIYLKDDWYRVVDTHCLPAKFTRLPCWHASHYPHSFLVAAITDASQNFYITYGAIRFNDEVDEHTAFHTILMSSPSVLIWSTAHSSPLIGSVTRLIRAVFKREASILVIFKSCDERGNAISITININKNNLKFLILFFLKNTSYLTKQQRYTISAMNTHEFHAREMNAL